MNDFTHIAYVTRLHSTLLSGDWTTVKLLAEAIRQCWRDRRRLFLCGNGGSAANAIHIANDLAYGIGRARRAAMRVQALPANVALVTCLANDEGYERIFARQLAVEGEAGDLLVVLSGSGNSANILEALKQARIMNIRSFAILGYSGGRAKELADVPIHFAIDDMQVAEDLQMITFHLIMQWLSKVGPTDDQD